MLGAEGGTERIVGICSLGLTAFCIEQMMMSYRTDHNICIEHIMMSYRTDRDVSSNRSRCLIE